MSLRSRLLLAIGYVLLVAIVAFEVPLAINTANRIDSEVRAQASAQADLLAVAAVEEINEPPRSLDRLVDTVAATVRGRVIVVDQRGRIASDSASNRRGADFSNRPEIEQALGGDRFQQDRRSDDLGLDLIATSAPMVLGGEVVGAVRITQSADSEQRALLDSIGGLVVIGLIVLGIGLIAAIVVAGQLSGPLRRMTQSAERIAAGDLDERVVPSGSSEQITLARSFNEMTARLADALRRQREFVADASHQLRTPITGLRLRLEEARDMLGSGERDANARAETEIEAATGEVDRLSGVVAEMLTLSQIGESPGSPIRVDLSRLAADAADRWQPEAQQRGIELTSTTLAPGTALCPLADVERALDALIENAIRYSPAGSHVEIRVAPREIGVIDDGPGIPPEELEMVFERFHRGRSGRAGPRGTGLGLAIARGLARSWGGEVVLETGVAGGTKASLTFGPVRSSVGEALVGR